MTSHLLLTITHLPVSDEHGADEDEACVYEHPDQERHRHAPATRAPVNHLATSVKVNIKVTSESMKLGLNSVKLWSINQPIIIKDTVSYDLELVFSDVFDAYFDDRSDDGCSDPDEEADYPTSKPLPAHALTTTTTMSATKFQQYNQQHYHWKAC